MCFLVRLDLCVVFFFFQAEDGIRDLVRSRGLGDVYKRQKNDIVRAGTTALKWAFNNDLIERDITAGLVFFSGHYKERQILTPEIVQALFSVPWNDERCKLCLLYTSDAADDLLCVDLGGRRIIKNKNKKTIMKKLLLPFIYRPSTHEHQT